MSFLLFRHSVSMTEALKGGQWRHRPGHPFTGFSTWVSSKKVSPTLAQLPASGSGSASAVWTQCRCTEREQCFISPRVCSRVSSSCADFCDLTLLTNQLVTNDEKWQSSLWVIMKKKPWFTEITNFVRLLYMNKLCLLCVFFCFVRLILLRCSSQNIQSTHLKCTDQ